MPQGWGIGVFVINELRYPTEKCVFDQGEGLYFDSYLLPPVFNDLRTLFEIQVCTYNDVQLQRPFSLAFAHYYALFALPCFAGCRMEMTDNRMEKCCDEQIENFVEQILMK